MDYFSNCSQIDRLLGNNMYFFATVSYLLKIELQKPMASTGDIKINEAVPALGKVRVKQHKKSLHKAQQKPI